MKLFAIFTLMLFSAQNITAQYIQITPNGFEYLQNKEKSYHIIRLDMHLTSSGYASQTRK